ncbi:MAG: hypothetical protein WEB03_04810 [Nitriliruptor sp.]|uniref:hypothetical protein n=1 Tax=Nitriliruptor sp. TaxID=2448056 RepID=UPI0034A03428
MEPLLLALIALAAVALVALVAGRNRRDASLEPTRLGPSWTPPGAGEAESMADPDTRARRIAEVVRRTEVDEPTAVAVLEIWDEYLGVLGLTPLPAGHRRRVYDPYDPPVARRGPDGRPEPDRDRVARDVAGRLGIDETVANAIIAADPGIRDDG